MAAVAIAGTMVLASSQQFPPLGVKVKVPPPQGTSPYPQQPRFRGGVNFVRVDVYPTANGRPVEDLRKDEFEVLEDGVPQNIASFEHVVVSPAGPGAGRIEPASADDADRMAGDPRNRVFVVFLDTYHVTDPLASHDGRTRFPGRGVDFSPKDRKIEPAPRPVRPGGIEKSLMAFLDRTLAPTDLVAVTTPDMPASNLAFSRRSEHLEELIQSAWARRFSWDNLDDEEESWMVAFSPDCPYDCFHGVAEQMVLRNHEKRTFDALGQVIARLGSLRQERKAIVVVSEGWTIFRPDRSLERPLAAICTAGCATVMPQPPDVTVGDDGKLKLGADPRSGMPSRQEADSARVKLARIDDAPVLRTLIGDANRSNASFYTIDPRGLAVFDTPNDVGHPGDMRVFTSQPPQPEILNDADTLRSHLEVLRTLATATDGRALVDSNDLLGSLKKISDDLSDYYLLGYNSTNNKADGKFRNITVRVKRSGVDVRARPGYRAPTEAELASREALAPPPGLDPEADARERAFARLSGLRSDRVMHVAAGSGWDRPAAEAGPSAASRPFIWLTTELDLLAARRIEWTAGALLTLTVSRPGGAVLSTMDSTLPSASPRAMVLLRDVLLSSQAREPLGPGEYLLQVRARTKIGDTLPVTEQVRVKIPESSRGAVGDAVMWRRGPFTGPAFQPTADVRFRRAEQIRADVPIAGACDAVAARLLDRKGQPLSVPVTAGTREQDGVRFASAQASLAPLAQADYLLEVSATIDGTVTKRLVAFRIVP